MRTFILKGICFILLFVALDVMGGKAFSLLHRYAIAHSPYGFLTEYAMEKVNTDVVIIGASTANHHYVPALLADSLQMSVRNCGKDGCGFLHQCCMIDGILKRYSPRIIIWDIIPSYLSHPSLAELDRLSDFNSYYDKNEYCRKVVDLRTPEEKFKMLSHLYRYNSRILPLIYKGVFAYNYPADGYLPLPDEGYKYPSLIVEKERDEFNEMQFERLVTIIDECKQKDVRLVLSLSPRFVKSDYLQKKVYEKWCEVSEKKGIPLIDFYNDPFFLNDSTLSKDNAHLNDKGARLFTEMWIQEYKLHNK